MEFSEDNSLIHSFYKITFYKNSRAPVEITTAHCWSWFFLVSHLSRLHYLDYYDYRVEIQLQLDKKYFHSK